MNSIVIVLFLFFMIYQLYNLYVNKEKKIVRDIVSYYENMGWDNQAIDYLKVDLSEITKPEEMSNLAYFAEQFPPSEHENLVILSEVQRHILNNKDNRNYAWYHPVSIYLNDDSFLEANMEAQERHEKNRYWEDYYSNAK